MKKKFIVESLKFRAQEVKGLRAQELKRLKDLFTLLPVYLLVALTFHFLLFAGFLYAADTVTKIAKKISAGAKSLKNKKVAVLPFPYHDGRQSQGSTIVSERLITKLVEQKKLEVVERSLLEKVFSELKLQSSGAIDEQSAKQLGKILGVEAIVSGTLIDLGEKEVEVNARLIQAESGQILVAASGKVERVWEETLASKKEIEEMPKEMAQSQVLSPGEQKLPPVSHPMDNPPAGKPSMHLGNHPRQGEEPTGMHQGLPPPLPHGEEMEIEEGEVLGGPAELLLFETDLGHERESSFGQQMLQGLSAIKERNGEKAERIFMRLKENQRDSRKIAVTHLGLSMSLFQQGKKEKAFRIAQEVAHHTKAMPKINAAAHFVLARYAESMDEKEAARQNYLQVIRNSPFQSPLVRTAGRRLRNLEGSEVREKMRERIQQRRERIREFRRR